MSFSAGGYNFEIAALSEKASRGKSHSDFVVLCRDQRRRGRSGGGCQCRCYRLLQSQLPGPDSVPANRRRVHQRQTRVGQRHHQQDQARSGLVQHDRSNHSPQSIAGTRGIYPAPGKIAPVYQGAIGVSDSGVEGVDVTVPAFEFSVRKKFEWVSTAYLLAIVSMTGRTNSTDWSIFAPGEALFLGGEGGEDEQNWVDITYHFAARPNQPALSVGSISGISKRGWDYLWVKHDEEVVGDRVLRTSGRSLRRTSLSGGQL